MGTGKNSRRQPARLIVAGVWFLAPVLKGRMWSSVCRSWVLGCWCWAGLGSGKSSFLGRAVSGLLRVPGVARDSSFLVLDADGALLEGLSSFRLAGSGLRTVHLGHGLGRGVASVNLLDPGLFPDEDVCVGNLVRSMKYTWETWGGKTEDILDRGLRMMYRHNGHPDTGAGEMLGLLDLPTFLNDWVMVGAGPFGRAESGELQRRVVARSGGGGDWLSSLLSCPVEVLREATLVIESRLGNLSQVAVVRDALGQRVSELTAADLSGDGLVVTASLPVQVLGRQTVSILGSAFSSLPVGSGRRWVVCDGMEAFPGVPWEAMAGGGQGVHLLASARGLRGDQERGFGGWRRWPGDEPVRAFGGVCPVCERFGASGP